MANDKTQCPNNFRGSIIKFRFIKNNVYGWNILNKSKAQSINPYKYNGFRPSHNDNGRRVVNWNRDKTDNCRAILLYMSIMCHITIENRLFSYEIRFNLFLITNWVIPIWTKSFYYDCSTSFAINRYTLLMTIIMLLWRIVEKLNQFYLVYCINKLHSI